MIALAIRWSVVVPRFKSSESTRSGRSHCSSAAFRFPASGYIQSAMANPEEAVFKGLTVHTGCRRSGQLRYPSLLHGLGLSGHDLRPKNSDLGAREAQRATTSRAIPLRPVGFDARSCHLVKAAERQRIAKAGQEPCTRIKRLSPCRRLPSVRWAWLWTPHTKPH